MDCALGHRGVSHQDGSRKHPPCTVAVIPFEISLGRPQRVVEYASMSRRVAKRKGNDSCACRCRPCSSMSCPPYAAYREDGGGRDVEDERLGLGGAACAQQTPTRAAAARVGARACVRARDAAFSAGSSGLHEK
eukprot:5556328-Pleurochrysis_carterae.AAC.1